VQFIRQRKNDPAQPFAFCDFGVEKRSELLNHQRRIDLILGDDLLSLDHAVVEQLGGNIFDFWDFPSLLIRKLISRSLSNWQK
jgi:hypothetical protein